MIHYSKISLIIIALFLISLVSCRNHKTVWLSDKEQEYLQKNNPEVLFGYVAPPQAFYDEDSAYVGMLVDYTQLIEEKIGHNFKFKDFESWTNLLDFSQNNNNFVIVGIVPTEKRDDYLLFTNTFLKTPYVIVARKSQGRLTLENLDTMKVCITKKYAIADFLEYKYPKIKYFSEDTDADGLLAVATGKYDAMIISQMYVTFIIEQHGISNLAIAGETDYISKLAAATSKNDPILFTIIDKAIDNIKPDEHLKIYRKWINQFTGEIPEKMIKTIILIAIIITLVVFLSWLWIFILRKQVSRKAAQIFQSEAKYRSLIENSNDMIFVIHKRKFLLLNKKFTEVFGYTENDVENDYFDFTDIVDDNDKLRIEKYHTQLQQGKKLPSKYEFLGITKHGGKIQIQASINFIKYGSGNAIQGILRDVTEEKLSEKLLIEAKEKAEENDKLKSAFLANMSHEIRTPMNGILGFASLLRDPNLSPQKTEKYIDIITKSGYRMLDTINNIINISKIESGQVKLNKQTFDINETIYDLFEFFRPETKEKNLEIINLKAKEEKIILFTDKEKIVSVVTNLFKNAIKYTDKGSITINYFITGDDFIFTITDTGLGISPERLDAIFERFVQADIEDKEVREGNGLGLSISKAYVDILGGKIMVESTPGKGSKFTFNIPIS